MKTFVRGLVYLIIGGVLGFFIAGDIFGIIGLVNSTNGGVLPLVQEFWFVCSMAITGVLVLGALVFGVVTLVSWAFDL